MELWDLYNEKREVTVGNRGSLCPRWAIFEEAANK